MSKWARTLFFIAVGGLLISCGLCGGCLVQGFREIPKVRSSAESFMDQLKAGQISEAYAATTREFQSAANMDTFRGVLEKFPALTKQANRTMGRCSIHNGNQARVEYSIVSPPNAITMSLTLSKVNDNWKVTGLHVP